MSKTCFGARATHRNEYPKVVHRCRSPPAHLGPKKVSYFSTHPTHFSHMSRTPLFPYLNCDSCFYLGPIPEIRSGRGEHCLSKMEKHIHGEVLGG